MKRTEGEKRVEKREWVRGRALPCTSPAADSMAAGCSKLLLVPEWRRAAPQNSRASAARAGRRRVTGVVITAARASSKQKGAIVQGRWAYAEKGWVQRQGTEGKKEVLRMYQLLAYRHPASQRQPAGRPAAPAAAAATPGTARHGAARHSHQAWAAGGRRRQCRHLYAGQYGAQVGAHHALHRLPGHV